MLRDDVPTAIALHPGILGEDKPMKALTKILDHVIAFWFAMHEQIQLDLLLEMNH